MEQVSKLKWKHRANHRFVNFLKGRRLKIFLLIILNLTFATDTFAGSLADRIKNDLKEECTSQIEWGQIKTDRSRKLIIRKNEYFQQEPNAYKLLLRYGDFYLAEVFQEKLSCLTTLAGKNSDTNQKCIDEFCPIKLLSPSGSFYVVGKQPIVSRKDQTLSVRFEVSPLYCQNLDTTREKCFQNLFLKTKENGEFELVFGGYSLFKKEISISQRPMIRKTVQETKFTLNLN